MTELKPLHDYVYLAKLKKDVVSKGGIHLDLGGINGVVASDTWQCEVLAIGPEVTDVKVGDVVYLMWNKAQVVKVGDAQRVIIKQEDIVAVLES